MSKRAGTTLLVAGIVAIGGCQTEQRDVATKFIAEMDARPPEDRVPHWNEIRTLMMREAPGVGQVAPDFELVTRDGSGTIRLSEYGGNLPVVLVFGSWT